MRLNFRTLFPYIAVVSGLAALVWATSFGKLEPADFTFINGTEIKSVDPAMVTGEPEGRIINALFEGLYRKHPKTLESIPGVAKAMPKISADKKTYTIELRQNAYWSDHTDENPSPVTAKDFIWTWRRFLHPEIAAEYGYILGNFVENGEKYYKDKAEVGDRVEVELDDRRDSSQVFPQGTIKKGTLKKIYKSTKPTKPKKGKKEEEGKEGKDQSIDEYEKEVAKWKEKWVYLVEVDGKKKFYSKNPTDAKEDINDKELQKVEVTKCKYVLLDFNEVGIKALDPYKIEFKLNAPTDFFIYILSFYPLHPVNRKCVEKYGYPNWTKVENVVSNGAFRLKFRRLRDRIRLVKSPTYWDADNVRLNTIDALAIDSANTQLNLFLNKQVDWAEDIPSNVIPIIEEQQKKLPKDERYLIKNANLAIYFYRINVRKKPFDNKLVRKALNMGLNKRAICENFKKGGEKPARSFVPELLKKHGYEPAQTDEYNPKKARELLAEAGYPNGKGLPTIEIIYNTNEGHNRIAVMIQDQWQRELGINVKLKNQEWKVFLSTVRKFDYDVARAAWIGDYPDPNTFLDLFLKDGKNNATGWHNERYDDILKNLAPNEPDSKKRFKLMQEAEQILMDEQPVIPIYYYVISNLVNPKVQGFYRNFQDTHPLRDLWIKE